MLELTVSKDNYEALVAAEPGSEVCICHKENYRPSKVGVLLVKRANIDRPVEMTVEEIEQRLGYRIKIIGGIKR